MLRIDPPTVTHQDKELGWRTGKGGKRIPTLRDSENLAGAIDTYDVALMTHAQRPASPMAGDLRLRVIFCWPGSPTKIELLPQKPDFDNAGKTLADALARAGYIVDDKMIVHGEVWKLRGPTGWIWIDISQADIDRLSAVLDVIYPQN